MTYSKYVGNAKVMVGSMTVCVYDCMNKYKKCKNYSKLT